MEINEKTVSKRLVLIITTSAFLAIAIIFAIISVVINYNITESNDLSYIEDISNHNESSLQISNIPVESKPNVLDASQTFAESDVDLSEKADTEMPETSNNSDEELSHGWVINKYGYTYVYDDCGYEQFNYSKQTLERYATSINSLANVLPAETNIYNITVPVSCTFADIPREIYIKDNFYNKSQGGFISTVETKLDERINNISLIPKMEDANANGDYIFFRTDRNWTALGAYNAYVAFCDEKGFNSYSINNFPQIEAGEYLGRFYLATESTDMKNNPDDFVYYSTLPSVKTSLTVYDYGTVYNDYVLCGNDVTEDNVYDIYLGTTAGRYEINTTAEGGSLLIIGDSSAHPLVPFIASHYSKIDVIDPQYFDDSIVNFLSNHNYDDVITMCYTTNATTGEYIPAFNTLTGVTEDNE